MATTVPMNLQLRMHRQAGVSILELMIAITIGLFLLAGLVSVFATSNQAYVELGRASQQIENGRLAMQILVDDVGAAGFFGRFTGTSPVGSAPIAPCESGASMANLRNDMALPLYGYDAPASVPTALATCLSAANFVPGTDILIVRRGDSTMAAGDSATIAAGALTAGGIYLQANADPTGNPIIAAATGAGGSFPSTGEASIFSLPNRDAATLAPIRKYHVHIYFVAPCSIPAGGGTTCTGGSDDSGAPVPTLKRIELTSNGVMTIVPLVEGIENFQVDYGVDADGQGVPDGAYITAPADATAWSNVVAVRVNVLARNIEATNGFTDPKTYDMGAGGTITPGGAYKRHVYNSVVRIVNIASRREQ
jgi:type IV pilus assembly protein PilW